MLKQMQRPDRGFTLIELLVTMAIIATLLSLAAPRYYGNVEKAKEATLQQNLATLRDVLDKHFADKGRYPQALDELIVGRYLRAIPRDPFTDSNRTWQLVPPADPQLGGIYDVRSGATGTARDGSRLGDW
ncbi:prepilin-type N-terminal cleavage/methylation domain-containing protein [Rugamonas sp. FT82W]|uniref:Prepilin-type N-terminal cleavage/methylation domain-containing protein n=1 Tax=Duganella vulcania TaxID=2692166 RepID=A0A845GC70_9BURK|nr:prepilin-type N-terminal cleavage/methylation domain-containing protein [Duganella vulcania]MYM90389.1 prepilin-type N-terminal cleavage/methylation domain-containing protein [Duganella vulcania]